MKVVKRVIIWRKRVCERDKEIEKERYRVSETERECV